MTVLIAASTRDLAAENIVDKIQRRLLFVESGMCFDGFPILRNADMLMVRTTCDSIYASELDQIPGIESIIFASHHTSRSGESTLTVHTPGNPLREAKYGGKPGSLAMADPNRMSMALRTLSSLALERELPYRVSLEATHHGPTEMKVPVLFVEIGSGPVQWRDELAGDVVAEAIINAAQTASALRPAVGFGGGHYASKFTDLVLDGEVCIGHIFPKYCIPELTESVMRLGFDRTKGSCTLAMIDWKGVPGADRARILDFLSGLGIETCRT